MMTYYIALLIGGMIGWILYLMVCYMIEPTIEGSLIYVYDKDDKVLLPVFVPYDYE